MIGLTVPPPDETTRDWWDATRRRELKVQACGRCRAVQHPPRALCASCAATDHLTLEPASGRGLVDSYTVVHRPPRPELEVPYVIARVLLEEGVIVLTRLEGRAPQDWQIGDAVQVSWQELPDGRALPVFVPTEVASPHGIHRKER